MNIVINALPHGRGGGVTYVQNLLAYFGRDGHHYKVLTRPRVDISGEYQNIEIEEVNIPWNALPMRILFEQAILPLKLAKWEADVLYSPGDLTTIAAPCPVVLQIQNINPYYSHNCQNCSRLLQAKFIAQRFLSRFSGFRADETIFVSEHARKIANSFLRIPESKTSVVHHGVNHRQFTNPGPPSNPRVAELVSGNQKYLLCISSIYSHKNFEGLIRGYALLPDELRDEYSLVIAGGIVAEEYYEDLLSIARTEGVTQHIEFLGRVPHDDTPNLYRNAELYALPSKVESFGLTLLEAMASGAPVAAANAACIPEIVGDAAALFDPDDPEDIADTLQDILTNSSYRETLAAAGRRHSSLFSWESTSNKVRTVLEGVIDEK